MQEKQENQDKPEKSIYLKKIYFNKFMKSNSIKEPPSFRFIRQRCQSQDSVISIILPDDPNSPYKQIQQAQEEKEMKKPIKWSLKKIFSVVEKQTKAIQTTAKLSQRSTHNTSNHTKDRSQIQIAQTARKPAEKDRKMIDEATRQRFSKFLMSSEITSAIQTKSLSKRKDEHPIYAEDIQQEITKAEIQQMKHQQIRFQYKKALKGSLTDRQMEKELIQVKIVPQLRSFNSVYQQIQQLSNVQTNKKLPLTQHQMLKRKKFISKPKLKNKLIQIMTQIMFIVKYSLMHRLSFLIPLEPNNHFFQLIIQGEFDQIKCQLEKEPYLVHLRNHIGQTPLHVACICNNLSITELLIRYHAHKEALDSKQLSPLYYTYRANSNDCMKSLLKHNVKPWSPPGGKINMSLLNIIQRNMLLHSRLIWMISLWRRQMQNY